MKNNPEQILRHHELKITDFRRRVLDIFYSVDRALSANELEERLKIKIDRVTLYRTLKTFQDHGLVHSVKDRQGLANYAICSSACIPSVHRDGHAHFNCSRCEKLYCLTDLPFAVPAPPPDFIIDEAALMLTGICSACSRLC